jgi:hypothetical protein
VVLERVPFSLVSTMNYLEEKVAVLA